MSVAPSPSHEPGGILVRTVLPHPCPLRNIQNSPPMPSPVPAVTGPPSPAPAGEGFAGRGRVERRRIETQENGTMTARALLPMATLQLEAPQPGQVRFEPVRWLSLQLVFLRPV